MSFFNPARIAAMLTGVYICPECGATMKWEDEWEDTLVCPKCGNSMDSDRYGFASEEEYQAQYQSKDDICDDDEDN